MDILLCPSMMCADFGDLSGEIRRLEDAGSDMLHIDIMDGNFVPNFGMGLQDTQYIIEHTNGLVDVHLMIHNPERYVALFVEMGADIVYIHAEADIHAPRTLETIRKKDAKAGLALNPGTSVEAVKPLLSVSDYLLVMTVNPGFSGQRYLHFADEKIDRLLDLRERYEYKIIIDGACSPEVIKQLSEKGVDGFVLGTSALFGKSSPYKKIMNDLRNL